MHSLEHYLKSQLLGSAAVLVSLCQDGSVSDGREKTDSLGNNNLSRHVEFLAEKRRS